MIFQKYVLSFNITKIISNESEKLENQILQNMLTDSQHFLTMTSNLTIRFNLVSAGKKLLWWSEGLFRFQRKPLLLIIK